MKLSVVICTYNRIRLLPYCIESIKTQTELNQNKVEVIFIDNNCTDGTDKYLKQVVHDNSEITISYYLETNQGLSHARNRGVKEAKGTHIAYIDDDAILSSNYFEKCLQFIQDNPDCDAFGGPIFVHFEDTPPSWENEYINSMFGYFNPSNKPFTFNSTNYPRGSNMIFSKSLFEEVGLFNPDLGRIKKGLGASEEKDLFARIYKANKTVKFDPGLIVDHIAPVERTKIEFIRNQATGTGRTEAMRVKSSGSISYIKTLFLEALKWVATFFLWFKYLLNGQMSKGNILIRFRYWISKGLLTGVMRQNT